MKLSIGSAQFGFKYGICNKKGIVTRNEIKEILKYCKLQKINSLDTAQGYGKSHKVLGSIGLKKFQVTTKISNIKKFKHEDLENKVDMELNKILEELKVKKIYALLIHNTDQLKGKFGKKYFKILKKLKNKKKFKKLGVSVYNKKELDLILKNYNIDIVNLPLSVANQEFCKDDYLFRLKKKGIEIHVRSIFLQGLLLTNISELPKKFKNNKFLLDWFDWLETKNYNPLDASLSFIKKIKHIDKIVIGIDNLFQLKDIVKSYEKKLSYNFIKFKQSSILRNPTKW